MTPVNIFRRGPKAEASRPLPAYCIEVRPLDYARIVHPRGGTGSVMFGDRVRPKKPRRDGSTDPRWCDVRYSSFALATRDPDLQGRRFMSFATWPYSKPGEPRPEKTAENVVSVSASWVDLDYYDQPDWIGIPPRLVLEAVRNICEDRGWPAPSYATHSGRGLLVVWLYRSQPAQAVLPRWKVVQQTLHEALILFGSDPSAKTITKQFRLPGTYNEKSGLPVSLIYPDLVAEIGRCDFDELCRVVLPFKRQTKAEKAAAKADAKAKRDAARLANRTPRKGHHGALLSGKSYWDTVAADLERLYAIRHGKAGIADTVARTEQGAGRNAWLLAFVYVAAWRLPADELESYVRETAERLGLALADARSKACTVVARAKEAARGGRRTYRDRTVDPRYKPSPAHLRDLLGVLPREMRRADLRMLIDEARRSENAVGRVVKARRTAGVKARDEQQRLRREVGTLAVEMVADLGMTVPELAAFFAASTRWMDNALRDARAIAGIGTAKPEPQPEPSVVVDNVADTLDIPPDPAVVTHEVLRCISARMYEGRALVVACGDLPYIETVTTKGSTLLGQTPVARRQARRASPCLAPVSMGV